MTNEQKENNLPSSNNNNNNNNANIELSQEKATFCHQWGRFLEEIKLSHIRPFCGDPTPPFSSICDRSMGKILIHSLPGNCHRERLLCLNGNLFIYFAPCAAFSDYDSSFCTIICSNFYHVNMVFLSPS